MTLEKYGDTIREMIFHENNLVNYRMTWFAVITAGLLAALGQLATTAGGSGATGRPAESGPEQSRLYLEVILCVIGFVTALTTWFSTQAASAATYRLARTWEAALELRAGQGWARQALPPVIGLYLTPLRKEDDDLLARRLVHFAVSTWMIIPLVFAGGWAVVFVRRFSPRDAFILVSIILVIFVFGLGLAVSHTLWDLNKKTLPPLDTKPARGQDGGPAVQP